MLCGWFVLEKGNEFVEAKYGIDTSDFICNVKVLRLLN